MWNLLLPLLGMGVGALTNRGSKTEQNQKTESQTDASTTPQYGDEENWFKNYLINTYLDRLQDNGDSYWNSYQQNGLKQFNQAEMNSNNILQQILTSRGIGLTGAGASALGRSAMNSQFQKANFNAQIPLLKDQRQQDNLKSAGGFFATLPYGQTQSSHTTSYGQSQNTQPGNVLGGGPSGLTSILASLYGSGAIGGGNSKSGTPALPSNPLVDYNIMGAPGYRLPGVR